MQDYWQLGPTTNNDASQTEWLDTLTCNTVAGLEFSWQQVIMNASALPLFEPLSFIIQSSPVSDISFLTDNSNSFLNTTSPLSCTPQPYTQEPIPGLEPLFYAEPHALPPRALIDGLSYSDNMTFLDATLGNLSQPAIPQTISTSTHLEPSAMPPPISSLAKSAYRRSEPSLPPTKSLPKRGRSASLSAEHAPAKKGCSNKRTAVVPVHDTSSTRPMRKCRTKGEYKEDVDQDNDSEDEDEDVDEGDDGPSPKDKQVSDRRIFKCDDPTCPEAFTRRWDAERHFDLKHKPAEAQTRFVCEYCGSKLSRKDGLRRHLRKSHPLTPQELESVIQVAVKKSKARR